MSLNIVSEIWDTVRDSIISDYRADVIHNMISLLVDNGYELEDLLEAFEGDREFIKAIKAAKDELEEESYEDYYEEDEEDY